MAIKVVQSRKNSEIFRRNEFSIAFSIFDFSDKPLRLNIKLYDFIHINFNRGREGEAMIEADAHTSVSRARLSEESRRERHQEQEDKKRIRGL
jgi:hypothetical protein